jgi:hypothetical protein
VLERGSKTVAFQLHLTLIRLAHVGRIQREGEKTGAEQFTQRQRLDLCRFMRHATQVEPFIAIHHQPVDRTRAAQLERQPSLLLEAGRDQHCHGGKFA